MAKSALEIFEQIASVVDIEHTGVSFDETKLIKINQSDVLGAEIILDFVDAHPDARFGELEEALDSARWWLIYLVSLDTPKKKGGSDG